MQQKDDVTGKIEQSLEHALKHIFEMNKVSYDEPGVSSEQNVLFIEVTDSVNTIRDQSVEARVEGTIFIVAPNDKLMFGFFSKKIRDADPNLTRKFFFYDFEANNKRYQNLVQRSVSFIYFFNSQYDPDRGSITSIDIKDSEE